jgi:hypothetical protein
VRYTSAGSKTISLTVTDSHNPANTATSTATVTVTAPPPLTANANGPYSSSHPGSPFPISGSGSGGVGPLSCAWSGASATFGSASSCTTTVTYAAAGSYTLTLTVTDSATPANTATSTATVTVTSPPPGPTCATDPSGDQFIGAADVFGMYDIGHFCGQMTATAFVTNIDTAGAAKSATLGAVVGPVTYLVSVNGGGAPWVASQLAGTWSITVGGAPSAGTVTETPTGVTISLPSSETGTVTHFHVQTASSVAGKGIEVEDTAPNSGDLYL